MNIRLMSRFFVLVVSFGLSSSKVFGVIEHFVSKESSFYTSSMLEDDQSVYLNSLSDFIVTFKAKCANAADRVFVVNSSDYSFLEERSFELVDRVCDYDSHKYTYCDGVEIEGYYRKHDEDLANPNLVSDYSKENESMFTDWDDDANDLDLKRVMNKEDRDSEDRDKKKLIQGLCIKLAEKFNTPKCLLAGAQVYGFDNRAIKAIDADQRSMSLFLEKRDLKGLCSYQEPLLHTVQENTLSGNDKRTPSPLKRRRSVLGTLLDGKVSNTSNQTSSTLVRTKTVQGLSAMTQGSVATQGNVLMGSASFRNLSGLSALAVSDSSGSGSFSSNEVRRIDLN